MQQLSGLDASFLYLESPRAPMHIGGVSIFEGENGEAPIDFETFRKHVASRLHLGKSFRRRLVDVPLGLDNPYWIEDPNFNLDVHLHHTALPKPGGWDELTRLVSRLLGQTLDRSRPLWEMTWVEGLDEVEGLGPGSVALIGKFHHAAIDGASGAEILGVLLDVAPEGRRVPFQRRVAVEKVPGDIQLLARTYVNYAVKPFKLPKLLYKTAKAAATTGARWRVDEAKLPPAPFSAPRTRLNSVVASTRCFDGAVIALDRIKAVKDEVKDATVNDVVLTVCAGALRNYLGEKGELPDKSLVAMCPISVRASHQKSTQGNQVSAMLVQLATDEADPLKRLKTIRENTGHSKAYHQAVDAKSLTDYTQFVPFSLGGLAARLYTRTQAARRHRPLFNLVITNVPGPPVPLYMKGARLKWHFGSAPLFEGLGLILVVFSYGGNLTISATSTRSIMPDVAKFAGLLRSAMDDLETAVAKNAAKRKKAPRKAKAKRPKVKAATKRKTTASRKAVAAKKLSKSGD